VIAYSSNTAPTWDPWGNWDPDSASTATSDNVVVIYISDRRSGSNLRRKEDEEEFRKSAVRSDALRESRLLALDPRPDPSPPRPSVPSRTGQDFHWMSQRKRCCRRRAPIPGYDRA